VARFSDPEPLSTDHVIEGFDCGRASLNVWLDRYVRQAAASGSARTYVTVVAVESLRAGSVGVIAHASTARHRVADGVSSRRKISGNGGLPSDARHPPDP
jgi:hypothetical protein